MQECFDAGRHGARRFCLLSGFARASWKKRPRPPRRVGVVPGDAHASLLVSACARARARCRCRRWPRRGPTPRASPGSAIGSTTTLHRTNFREHPSIDHCATFVAAAVAHAVDDKVPDPGGVAHGKYLVLTSGCVDCRTPQKMGPNGPEPDISRPLSGHPESLRMPPAPHLPPGPWLVSVAWTNRAWAGLWGAIYTTNLTPGPEMGPGQWIARDFNAIIRTGRHRSRGPPGGAADAFRGLQQLLRRGPESPLGLPASDSRRQELRARADTAEGGQVTSGDGSTSTTPQPLLKTP